MMTDTTWQELFPQGRTIFYEGDDPQVFAQEIHAAAARTVGSLISST